MNPANPQDERFRGLLDLLIKDEQKRAAMRGKAEDFGAAAAMVQQFAVPQPMPLQNTGGLLQQPQMVNMTSGTGIMGLQPSQDEDGSKKEAMIRLMKYLGMA